MSTLNLKGTGPLMPGEGKGFQTSGQGLESETLGIAAAAYHSLGALNVSHFSFRGPTEQHLRHTLN